MPSETANARSRGPELESEGIFRLLVDSVTDYAIFVLDPRGHIVTWNPGAERFKGYKAEEIIGKHFSIFYPEKDNAAGKPQMELEVAAKEGHFEDEGWRIRKDGTRFWANVVLTRLCDGNGEVIGYGKITRDLSDRRLADQRYKMMIENVQDYAIFSLDARGYVTSWNAGAQRIKGYASSEIIGQHFSVFYTEEDRVNHLPQHVLEQARTNTHWEGEGWRVRKDGTRFWSLVVVTAVFDDEGTLTGFSKVTRDMTDRKMLLEQISAHAKELELRIAEREATNAELEAFSYSVSHDLRAPLRAVDGFASALREDYSSVLDETGLDYLNEIQSAARRMNSLVQDLLNYSRLGRLEMAFSVISVRRITEVAVGEFAAQRENIRITVDPELRVLSHDPTLRQVLVNLIGNGLKFHRPDTPPRIVISARRVPGGKIRIAVADNGIGISPEHHDRIFKVFERLHTSDVYQGTGIGLAIVQRGIHRMGGKLGLESRPGEGTTFWFELNEAGGAH